MVIPLAAMSCKSQAHPSFARLSWTVEVQRQSFQGSNWPQPVCRMPQSYPVCSDIAQNHLCPTTIIFQFCEFWKGDENFCSMHGLATFKFVNQMSLCLFRPRQNVTTSKFLLKTLCQISLLQTVLKGPYQSDWIKISDFSLLPQFLPC